MFSVSSAVLVLPVRSSLHIQLFVPLLGYVFTHVDFLLSSGRRALLLLLIPRTTMIFQEPRTQPQEMETTQQQTMRKRSYDHVLANKRKKLKDTAKPLVLAAAYEGMSKVTGSNAIAFGLVGAGAYALASRKKKRRVGNNRSGGPTVAVVDPSSSSSDSEDAAMEGSPRPLLKRRRMRSQSFLNLVDLLKPTKIASTEHKKKIRAFPSKISNKIWKLYTAPVEEKIEEDMSHDFHEHGAEETSSLAPGRERLHDKSTASVTIIDDYKSSRQNHDDDHLYSHCNSSYDDDDMHTCSNKSRGEISDLPSSVEASKEGDDSIVSFVDIETTPPVSPKGSSSMNINPSAAFGVAAELCRKQMDQKSSCLMNDGAEGAIDTTTRTERRRFLQSLYAHAGIPSDTNDTKPLSTPLVLATNYNIRSSGAWSDDDHFYSRISNPTRDALESVLARAEEGEREKDTPCQASCFASGMVSFCIHLGTFFFSPA